MNIPIHWNKKDYPLTMILLDMLWLGPLSDTEYKNRIDRAVKADIDYIPNEIDRDTLVASFVCGWN